MLKSKRFANRTVATQYGAISFNSKGESTDLTEAQEKHLAELPEFTYEKSEEEKLREAEAKKKAEDKKKADAKKVSDDKKKAEAKKEAPKKEAPKKKATPKKK